MRTWHTLRARVASTLRRRRSELDLHDELQAHIEQHTAHLQARGVEAVEARRQALRAFGGVSQVAEECRDARGTAMIDAFVRDLRHGTRRLLRDWRFTTAAVVICGVGIGASTAIFSVVNAALLRPQATVSPDRLVDIYQRGINKGGIDANSYPAYQDMSAYTDVFAAVTAASVPIPVTFRDTGAIRQAVAEYTTASYPSVIGLAPFMGRWFDESEERQGSPVVVIGHKTWTRKFDSDPAIIGRTIQLQGIPLTIVGVGPRDYNGTFNVGVATDFWLPVPALAATSDGPSDFLARRPQEAPFLVKARLKDTVTVSQAQAAMKVLGARLASEYPNEDPGQGIAVFASRDVRIHPQLDTVVSAAATVMLVLVGLVLAVACSNIATLLLVRGASRARELSTRLAVGATRRQLIRLLLIESLLLSVAGGVAGSLVAWWAIRLIAAMDLPVIVDISLDYRVLLFALVLSLLTGFAFGLAPALNATRIDLVSTLRGDGDTRWSGPRPFLKHGLVVMQVAISVVLLGAAALVLQVLDATRSTRAGYAVDGVAIVQADTRYAGYSKDAVRARYDEMRQRLATTPGVEAVALTRGVPMEPAGQPIVIDGENPVDAQGRTRNVAVSIWASPGYFDVLRIPLRQGRPLDDRDGSDAPRVAVVTESMARRFFGSLDVIGRRFRLESDPDGWMQIVGIARDTGTADLQGDLTDPTREMFYRPYAQWGVAPTTIVARSSSNANRLVSEMQRQVRAVDATLPITSAMTMTRYLDDSLAPLRTTALALGVLGAIAAILASIGLYAVISFTVSRRMREIGIRMALGASRGRVVWSLTRQVGVMVAAGTAAGLLLFVLSTRALGASSSPAPGVSIYRPDVDPQALAAIALLMAFVGVVAALLPARRAASMDPLTALRHD